MELNNYCDNMAAELSGWRARVHDVVGKLDSAPTGDKVNVISRVNDLHMIMEELDDRISHFKTECPVGEETDKTEIEKAFGHLKRKWEHLWEKVSPGDIGG
jgi:hypothetical protein